MDLIKTHILLSSNKVTFRTPIERNGVRVISFLFDLKEPQLEVYGESLSKTFSIRTSLSELTELQKLAIKIHKRGYVTSQL